MSNISSKKIEDIVFELEKYDDNLRYNWIIKFYNRYGYKNDCKKFKHNYVMTNRCKEVLERAEIHQIYLAAIEGKYFG